MNGTLGGLQNECIAPSCTPAEVGECRGDVEVRCNATGDDFELTRCPLGCDPDVGCRLCEPGQTACTNGMVASCDDTGAVTESHACPLGCFEDEPRCRDIDPSNGLGIYFDMVAEPPDLDLSAGGTIDTSTGVITRGDGTTLEVPSFAVPAPADGAPIRVFVANAVTLGDVQVTSTDDFGGPALAILASGDLVVQGTVTVATGDMTTPADCVGDKATEFQGATSKIYRSSGSGGGANVVGGGRGGDVGAEEVGGAAGMPAGTAALVPLRGGCASGGFVSNVNSTRPFGVRGGGAIQLTGRTLIRVTGTIDVNGAAGASAMTKPFLGGGAGGGVLLEAPVVTLEGSGGLLANGGDGNGCTTQSLRCGQLGFGGTASTAAGDGGVATDAVGVSRAGGGGGAVGRIRINTADGNFLQNTAFRAEGALTSDVLVTR